MMSFLARQQVRRGAAIAACVVATLAPLAAGAADLCVDAAAAGGGDGSPAAPYASIVEALAVALPGDSILVAGGTYAGRLDLEVADLSVLGGYPGGGDFSSADPATYPTLVTASGDDVVTAFDAGAARLAGLTISGGTHGIYVEGFPQSDHGLVVEDCVVENNGDPGVEGGGIYAGVPTVVRDSVIRGNVGDRGAGISGEGDLTVEGSIVEDNVGHGDHGGGIYAYGELTVLGTVIRNNRIGETAGYGWGGGLILYGGGSTGLLRGNVVTGNFAPLSGSGEFIDDGAYALIQNELVVDNVCGTAEGAGLYVDGLDDSTGTEVDLVNVTIAGHDCDAGGNALLVERASTVTITSSIVWGNGDSSFAVAGDSALGVTYSDVEDGAPGTGNLQVDPLFGDAAGGDYHLRSTNGRPDAAGNCVVDGQTSPAIDAGDPAGDFSLEPTPNGDRIDMGTYGGTILASCDPETATVSTSVSAGTGDTTSTGPGGPGSGASTGAGDGGSSNASGGDGDGDGDGSGDGDGDGDGDASAGGASADGAGDDDGCGCGVTGAEPSSARSFVLQALATAAAAIFIARRRAR